jgi:hypothetical protein
VLSRDHTISDVELVIALKQQGLEIERHYLGKLLKEIHAERIIRTISAFSFSPRPSVNPFFIFSFQSPAAMFRLQNNSNVSTCSLRLSSCLNAFFSSASSH